MNLKRTGSRWDRNQRININDNWDDIEQWLNQLAERAQDLVAEGQLTPEQIAEMFTVFEGLVKKGDMSVYDINKNKGKFDSTYFSSDFLADLNNGVINATELLPGSVTSDKIADKGVSPGKTTFLNVIKSVNLFDKTKITSGYYVNPNDGQLVANSSLNASEYIPVDPNSTYRTVGANTYKAVYDADKNFINGVTATSIDTPANGAFIRVTVRTTELDSEMVVKGNTLPPDYIPFTPEVYLNNGVKVVKENLPDGGFVGLEDISFVKKGHGTNLFDKSKVTDGYYVNNNTGGLASLSNYSASDYIQVNPNTVHTSTNSSTRAYYDENKSFIEGYANTTQTTSPSNAAYMRFSIITTALDSTMLVEGETTPSSYTPFETHNVLDGVKVDFSDVLNTPDELAENTTWTGKRWVAIGDSITQYDLADEDGIVTNWAVDASERLGVGSLKRCAQEGKAMHEIDSIMTFSGTTEQDLIDADLITVSLGQNDRTNALGEITDPPSNDGTNFTGSTKWLIEYLLGLNPTCTLVFITPTPSKDRQERLTNQADIIKNVCALYSVPVFDLNRKIGFNALNYTHFYMDNWVHPNGRGYRRMGRLTAEYLRSCPP